MKTHQFDVLVVYSRGIAASASTTDTNITEPFLKGSANANYNDAYAYFLSFCQKNKLKAAFTTTSEIIGAGTCKSYWLYKKNSWIKVKNICYAPIIFDKFAPINQERINARLLLFSSENVTPFNDRYLLALFQDKLATYQHLTSFSIPTMALTESTTLSIKKALKDLKVLLKEHPNQADFSSEIVVKDRSGAGGNNIYKVASSNISEIQSILNKNKLVKFVIQPLVKFDQGFIYKNKPSLTDIRLIFLHQKIVQAYIRIAKPNEFRCNEHQGGTLEYISLTDIPKKVLSYSRKILQKLTSQTSLFALDFIVSNNGNVFLLEGNIGPGLDWNLSKPINEQKAKQLIQLIVNEISNRTEQAKLSVDTTSAAPNKAAFPYVNLV